MSILRKYGVHNDSKLEIKSAQACECGENGVKFVDGKSVCAKCKQSRTIETVETKPVKN